MARKRRTQKKRRTKTLAQRVTALEKALRPMGPAKPRGRRAASSTSAVSDDGPKYLGAYRL